jgi:hypothetical protein
MTVRSPTPPPVCAMPSAQFTSCLTPCLTPAFCKTGFMLLTTVRAALLLGQVSCRLEVACLTLSCMPLWLAMTVSVQSPQLCIFYGSSIPRSSGFQHLVPDLYFWLPISRVPQSRRGVMSGDSPLISFFLVFLS